MKTYQFIDGVGFVQDVTFCIDLVEAIEFADAHDLQKCTIVELGPTSDWAWAEVAA